MERNPRISIIAAIGKESRAIGRANHLIWSIKEDTARFKNTTMGHPVIMGRQTWLSLPEPFRPLPGRTNIVLSRADWFAPVGIRVARTLQEALDHARTAVGADEIFIIGGAMVYAEALPFADRLYLTEIEDDAEGDAFFPAFNHLYTKEVEREEHPEHVPPYTFLTLER